MQLTPCFAQIINAKYTCVKLSQVSNMHKISNFLQSTIGEKSKEISDAWHAIALKEQNGGITITLEIFQSLTPAPVTLQLAKTTMTFGLWNWVW